eukprot:440237-Rhodomonas_salina.1
MTLADTLCSPQHGRLVGRRPHFVSRPGSPTRALSTEHRVAPYPLPRPQYKTAPIERVCT